MENKKLMSKKKIIISCVAVIALISIIAVVMIVNNNKSYNDLQKLLDLGNKYIAELNYEQAIVAFRNAIDIDPKCEEAYKALVDIYVEIEDYDSALEILQMAVENVDNTEYFAERIIEVNELVNQQYLALNEQNKDNEQKDKLESSEEKTLEVNSETSEIEQDKPTSVQEEIDGNQESSEISTQTENENLQNSNVDIENIGEASQSEDENNIQSNVDNSNKTEEDNGNLKEVLDSIDGGWKQKCDYYIYDSSQIPYRESPKWEAWGVNVIVYANSNREYQYVYLNIDYDDDGGNSYFMKYDTFQNWLSSYKVWILENDKDYNPFFIGNLVKSRTVCALTYTRNVNGKIYNTYDMESNTWYDYSVDGYVW
jgi:tetratricopeptide (TPR) repeat protein